MANNTKYLAAIIVLLLTGIAATIILWPQQQAQKNTPVNAEISLQNGTVVQGRIVQPTLTLVNSYAVLQWPMKMLKSLQKLELPGVYQLTTVVDDSFSGFLTLADIAVQSNDSTTTLPLKQIKIITFADVQPHQLLPLEDIVLTRSADLFSAKITAQSEDIIKLNLNNGQTLTVHTSEIAALHLASKREIISQSLDQNVLQQRDPHGEFSDPLSAGGHGPALVKIPAGTFLMGSGPDSNFYGIDEQQHQVTIEKLFAIGKYEVSFAEYDYFARSTYRAQPKDKSRGRGNKPVVNITWFDAVAYTDWLSKQTGHHYRLPTEVEWEFVARAGTTSDAWWGDEISPNIAVCLSCPGWGKKSSAAVNWGKKNPFGIYNILGNVWEWTCSDYHDDYDGAEIACAPTDDNEANARAIRGGGWGNELRRLRAANRDTFIPADKNDLVGFRVLREL